MSQALVYAVSVALTALIQLSGFAVAFALQTEVFYDILGGTNFLALAAWSSWCSTSWLSNPRQIIATVLFVISRGWLLVFLAWRAHERKGDARFDGVKDKFGRFLVFWIAQGMWVMLISMPNLFINSSSVSRPLNWFDWLLVAGFAYAVAVEILADIQKANWVSAGRPGGFCQVGVWSLSRHPNYFGEIFQWWCAFALAYNSSEASSGYMDPLWWACILSPLFTMHILLNIGATGISNAEGKNLKRYYEKCPEEYAEYRKNTSILIPMVGYRHIPLSLKRTLLFEFERYEYRPGGSSPLQTQILTSSGSSDGD
mmetsp:Transcript_35210/g.73219  ORF Transcript_35210/g.73219 Transcript_35210/m.73219 type:complete len:313 (-) Transcript_35210:29-967(-)